MDAKALVDALFLGLVEGLTEFLPVSSTGHLILTVDLLGFATPPGKTFEIAIQSGAIAAVCITYWRKFWAVFQGLVLPDQPEKRRAWRFVRNLALAFAPAVIFGLLLHDVITRVLFSPWVVCISLIVGGIIILWVERRPLYFRYRQPEEIPAKRALMIGLCQAVAMIPGVSRSGATIIGAMLLGVERKTAAEFSFFLGIPTLLSASLYELYKHWETLDANGAILILTGFLSAFVSALIVIQAMIAFIVKRGFAPFGWYRIAVGILMLIILATR